MLGLSVQRKEGILELELVHGGDISSTGTPPSQIVGAGSPHVLHCLLLLCRLPAPHGSQEGLSNLDQDQGTWSHDLKEVGQQTHLSVEDAVHEEDHEPLECGKDAEQPLKDVRHGAVVHYEEPQHPGDSQDWNQHQRGMEQSAGKIKNPKWRDLARDPIDYLLPRWKVDIAS